MDLDQQLDWLRRVESIDEEEAKRRLRRRLRADARRARREVRMLEPWTTMSPTVRDMLRRDGEIVRLHRLVEAVPAGARVLDVGCGPGVVAGTLARHDRIGAYLGIDLNETKIESARRMASAHGFDHLLRFEVADALDLRAEQLAGLSPDIVLVLEVLEHLTRPTEVLASIAELVPDRARVVFSVPILGRIEACWGHRTLYGADAVVGLAEGSGLRLLDVREVHDTWALATATREGAPRRRQPEVAPLVIRHVTADRLRSTDAPARTLTGPARVLITVPAGQVAHVEAETPGADWLRVDVGCEPPGTLDRMEITTLDAGGSAVRTWTPGLDRLAATARATVVVRPASASPSAPTSTPARTRLALRAGPSDDAEITVWRLGFAAGYDHLRRSPREAPPGTSGRRRLTAGTTGLARRTVRRSPRLRALVRRWRGRAGRTS